MKKVFATVVVGLTLNAMAYADIVTKPVVGADARAIIEALVGAGFAAEEIVGEDDSLAGFKVETGTIVCKHPHMTYPDEWLSQAHCMPAVDSETYYANPMSLLRALMPYAAGSGAAGTIYYFVEKVSCSFDLNLFHQVEDEAGHEEAVLQAYGCSVSVVEEGSPER